MGTNLKASLWDFEFYRESLKLIFGNRKNYNRYMITQNYNQWTNWLINLGYRG